MKIKLVPWFSEMVDILWKNKQIFRQCSGLEEDEADYTGFDFPGYGGLPSRISWKLWSDTVDTIQDYSYELYKCKTKKSFAKKLTEILLGEFAKVS